MSKIPAINEIDANSPSQESTEVVVKATTVTPDINEIQETISGSATIQEIDGTRKPTISEIYKIVNDGLFESTTNWWDYAYKISQAQLNQDIISRLDNGVIGGGYSKGVDIITTTSNKVPTNTNVYSALKSDSLYPKKLNDEVINGIYDFLNGLTIGKPTAYTGGTWSVDQIGKTHLTTDYLYVRLKAIFETLQILNVDTIGGKLVISPAGSIKVAYVDRIKIDAPVFKHDEETDVWSISQVEDAEGNFVNETLNQEVYRCYFLGEQDGEEIDNKWKVGDQAQAKTFNVKKGTYHKVENSYLWRLVVNVSSKTVNIDGKKYHYVDLSQIDFDSGSDAPAPGDVLNQLGHRLNDTQRQTALVLNAVDNYAPSITLYAGVNYYTLLNKEYVEFGVYNGKAFFNVYGDMYIGDKGTNPKTYIKYKNGKINIKANLEIGSSIGDKDLDQYIKENGGVDEETVKNLINNAQVIKDLQNQADGAIETWFYEGVPTPNNYPSTDKENKGDVLTYNIPGIDWYNEDINNYNAIKDSDKYTEAEKEAIKVKARERHIGDLYYDQKTGYAYRFTRYDDDIKPYRWNVISDNELTKILEAANRAQATADGKMKVFYDETKPTNYKVGDMWVNATLEGKFNNDIVRAVADNETFNANDWVLASRYSEAIATIQKWTNEYETKFGIIKDQIDGKAGTWYQIDDPSTDWKDKASHEGDIWYNTTNGTTNYWNGSAWEQMDIPKDVFDTIDGKSSIFVDSYVDAKAGTGVICKGYKERDLWILPEDATVNGTAYYKGDMLTAVSNNKNFDETNWKKKVRYVGQTELTSAIDVVNEKINTINNTTIPGINNKFNEFVKDGVLDSSEKARLTDLLNQANNEVAAVVDQVNNIITSKYLTNDNANKGKLEEANTVMNTAWTEYKNLINTLIDANTEITKVNIGEANTKYKNLQEKIKAVKQYLAICQADVLSGMGTDISSYKYLKEAFKGKTEINGGLVVTNVLQLRQTSDASSPITAGISGLQGKANADGVVDKNTYDITSIAAWFGGPMVDKDIFTDEQLNNKVAGTDYARSLFRHDGSGYLASGAIYWGTDGVLHGDPNSFILQGTSIATMFYYVRLFYLHNPQQGSTDFNKIAYVTPMKTFSRLSVLSLGGIEDGNNLPTGLFIGDSNTGGSFQIGNIILRTKSGDPNILEIVSADSKKTAHLGVQGGVSAYGTYTSSTGGGGGLNGTIVHYSTAIASDPQNEGSKIASASSIYKLHSRISNIENNGATSITVTGTGNAITSVSKNGTSITFTKGTTFLTSHQSLADYYTKSQVNDIANNKSDVGHTHNYITDGTMTTITGWNNEVNFGGTNNSNVIYFSYRAQGNKPIISNFIFGGSTGTATLQAAGFKINDCTSSQFLKADGSIDSNIYAGSDSAGGDATRALKLKDYNGKLDIYCGYNGSSLTADKIGYIVGTKFVDNAVYYNDVSKDELKKWLGLGDRAYDSTTYLPTIGGTLTGNLNGTTAVFCGRINGSYDDEGILIKPANNGFAGLVLGTTNSDRASFYFSENNTFWRYVKNGIETNIYHPHKDGTIALTSDNVASATKLQTPRTIWGQSFDGTRDVNGTIYINNSDSSNGAIRLNNNVNSNARISAIDDKVIFNTSNAIRFGETAWDWNQWAGLKYTHSNKTIYLGIADGSVFKANNAQSDGTLRLAGIKTVTPDSGARIGDSGGDLYLGNANNSGWVKIQNMCSQVNNSYWNITQNGSATFKSININGDATIYGNCLATGGVTAYQSSDIRLKTNITKLNCLKVIKSIGGTYEFDYIRDHKHSIGFIAQNVNNPLLNDIVAKDDNGYLKINYWNPKLISLAFGALTEIDDEVDKLKARVRELENEVEYLKNKDYALQ